MDLIADLNQAIRRVAASSREMALKSQQDPRYTTDPDFARKIDRVLAVTDPEYVEAHLS